MHYSLLEIKKNIKRVSTMDIHHFLLENKELSKENMDFFCDELVNRGDGYYLYWTAIKVENANISILQKGLFNIDKPEFIRVFLEDVKDFNYDQLYDDLLRLSNGSKLVWFYNQVGDLLDCKKIEDIAIEIADENSLISFLKTEGFNHDRLYKAILDSDCVEAMITFGMMYFQQITNMSELEDRVILKGKNRHIREFAAWVPGANVEKLFNVILDSNSAFEIVDFFLCVEDIDIKKVEDKLIYLKNYPAIMKFARCKGANIKRLEDMIIKSGNLDYMAEFLIEVKGANKERLIKEIVSYGNQTFIEGLAIELEENDYKLLMKYYKKITSGKYIGTIKKRIDQQRNDFKKTMASIEEMMETIDRLLKR